MRYLRPSIENLLLGALFITAILGVSTESIPTMLVLLTIEILIIKILKKWSKTWKK